MPQVDCLGVLCNAKSMSISFKQKKIKKLLLQLFSWHKLVPFGCPFSHQVTSQPVQKTAEVVNPPPRPRHHCSDKSVTFFTEGFLKTGLPTLRLSICEEGSWLNTSDVIKVMLFWANNPPRLSTTWKQRQCQSTNTFTHLRVTRKDAQCALGADLGIVVMQRPSCRPEKFSLGFATPISTKNVFLVWVYTFLGVWQWRHTTQPQTQDFGEVGSALMITISIFVS